MGLGETAIVVRSDGRFSSPLINEYENVINHAPTEFRIVILRIFFFLI